MARQYEIRRSARRTMALELTREGKLLVRAPRFVSAAAIRRLVEAHEDWISRAEQRQSARNEAHPEPTEAERAGYIRRAKAVLPGKVAHYAAQMGVAPTRITITSARTRFGSCSMAAAGVPSSSEYANTPSLSKRRSLTAASSSSNCS